MGAGLGSSHALLCFSEGNERVSGRARQAMEVADALCALSITSAWEVAIKVAWEAHARMPATALRPARMFRAHPRLGPPKAAPTTLYSVTININNLDARRFARIKRLVPERSVTLLKRLKVAHDRRVR